MLGQITTQRADSLNFKQAVYAFLYSAFIWKQYET